MNGSQHVGKCYRGSDGVVRWVTHQSKRGMLHMLWQDDRGAWHDGGSLWPGRVIDVLGDEVPAPAPGSTIRVVGLTGMMSERVVPSAKETT